MLDFKTPTVFAAFLELPPDSLNSNKAKRGGRTTALGPRQHGTCPHGVGPAPGCAPTGDGPTNSCCLFFLKALFLRLQKTQPQKPIRTIKKRHKLASSDGFEKLKPTPRLTVLSCPVKRFVQLCPAPATKPRGTPLRPAGRPEPPQKTSC